MDVQSAPPTYTPTGARPLAGNPPVLGQQVPGMSGGLPAQGGLSVTANPMAQELRSYGRGDDTMLVHMTPGEVNSLQGLAMATGGSLTINPHTGLPEAGWLGKLLPTILGIAGAAVGIPTWAMGLGGTAVGTAVTGDLGKGLMAGLGAYGGAGLGNALGLGGSLSPNAFGLLGEKAATDVAGNVAANAAANLPGAPSVALPAGTPTGVTASAFKPAFNPGTTFTGATNFGAGANAFSSPAANALAQLQAQSVAAGIPFAQGAGSVAANAAKPGFLDAYKAATNIKGLGNIGAIAGGLGVLSNISEATAPKLPKYEEEETSKYEGPYIPTPRRVIMPTTSARERKGGEHMFFDNPNPVPGFEPYNPMGMAEGGAVPSRTSSERVFDFAPSTMPVGSMPALQAAGNMPGGIKGSMIQKIMAAAGQTGGSYGTPTAPPSAPRPVAGPYTPGRERDFGFRPLGGSVPMAGAYAGNPYSAYFGEFNPMDKMGAAYARGGEIPLSDGSFVLDARTVSEIGNGSSNAGKEILRAIGGLAVEGPGDGVSDSVPARIGRNQPARVARDEVIVPAEAVRKIGKGNPKRGADKLYALMKKAHAARKKAKRGQDTKLRRGLA